MPESCLDNVTRFACKRTTYRQLLINKNILVIFSLQTYRLFPPFPVPIKASVNSRTPALHFTYMIYCM
jgi:hypothetical protein